MQNTLRKFKIMNLKCTFNCADISREILKVHGPNIEELNFDSEHRIISINDLGVLLGYFPNLKKLKLKGKELKEAEARVRRGFIEIEELSLDFEKSVDLKKLLNMFSPNMIKKFSIHSNENIETFFNNQQSIKEIEISNYKDLSFYKKLKLEKVTFYIKKKDIFSIKLIRQFIEQQPYLKEIRYYPEDEDEEYSDFYEVRGYLEALSRLEHLETLDFFINFNTIDNIKQLSKIKTLKNLRFINEFELNDEPKIFNDKLNIESFEIRNTAPNEDSIVKMKNNWTNLKYLKFDMPYSLSVNVICREMTNLQSLTITFTDREYFKDFLDDEYNVHKFKFNYDGRIYPKLTKLEIHFPLKISVEMLESFPNLEYLNIYTLKYDDLFSSWDYSSCYFTIYSIKILQFLLKMRKLKSLFIYFLIEDEITITKEFELIKNLYYKLDEFKLEFKSNNNIGFNSNLASLLHPFMNVDLIVDEQESILCLTK